MPTTLPEEQGETTGNPSTGGAEGLQGKCWDFKSRGLQGNERDRRVSGGAPSYLGYTLGSQGAGRSWGG